jgi:stage II sporulation protein AA (anti-sigma F factor antagonist)
MSGIDFRVSPVRHEGELAALEVSGEIDMANAERVRSALLEAVPAGSTTIVLDFRDLLYLDSAGVRLLFEVAEHLAGEGVALAASAPPGSSVRKILAITKLDTLVPIRDSIDEAAAAAASSAAR